MTETPGFHLDDDGNVIEQGAPVDPTRATQLRIEAASTADVMVGGPMFLADSTIFVFTAGFNLAA